MSAEQFLLDNFDDNYLMGRISQAQKVYSSGITLSGSISSLGYFNSFKECLSKGGEVRILMVDPDHAAFEAASKRFHKHQNIEKIKLESGHSLNNFDTLKQKNVKNFQIRLSQIVPSFGIWVIDGDEANGEIWVRIYSFRGAYDPAMRLLPSRDGKWYTYFKTQFEQLWEHGTDWP